MSFRKDIFSKAGFFDANFTGNAYREDTDMSVRTRRSGYKIIYEPKAAIIHYMDNTGGTRSSQDEKYWGMLFKNQCYYFLKNFKSPKFIIKLVSFFDLSRCKRQGFSSAVIFNRAYQEARKSHA
jgi:GT2 family glycosyltransferase